MTVVPYHRARPDDHEETGVSEHRVLAGVLTVIQTPFRPDGDVDEAALAAELH